MNGNETDKDALIFPLLEDFAEDRGLAPGSLDCSEHASLPVQGQDFRFGNIVFTSKFDSGNLMRVEKVNKDASVTENKPGYLDPVTDLEFNVWTRPDCYGSPFENGNRSWFYFGIKGYPPGKSIKINIMNMNKQGKLYSQGHSPIFRILPQRPTWERLKERCTFESSATDFILSFYFRFPEFRGTAYFSFCYPWSYTESQQQMEQLDQVYQDADIQIKDRKDYDIYYHRELITKSLDGLRVDLLTISSYDGITESREPRFDNQLFPETDKPRCRNFKGKKVFVLTSRVHPGESPASSVYNGFLEFILRKDDMRAVQLRKQYVFKMIPMLNPDGVVRGHYRTDSRGVNLNRVYLSPEIDLYPTIYAAKSLLVFHHLNNCTKRAEHIPDMSVIFKDLVSKKQTRSSGTTPQSNLQTENDDLGNENLDEGISTSPAQDTLDNSNDDSRVDSCMDRCSSIDSHYTALPPISSTDVSPSTDHLNHPFLRYIPAEESGVAFYVDLHGHASKRGCFMYGNHFAEEEQAVQNLLFPKLIAMNSAHFDYGGCNFTEKNMYAKDKRDSHSKEGSGRVAMYKSIGIVHSYTLECNYNSGRLVNSIASSLNPRITPPPVAGFPPKFTQAHYEEVGRGLVIAAIDYTDSNPWSRIQGSELPSVHLIKDWIRKSLRSGRGVTKFNKPALSINPKLLSKNTMVSVRSEPFIRSRQNPISNQTSEASKIGNTTFGRTPRFGENETANSSTNNSAGNNTSLKRTGRELGPVREGRRSLSLPAQNVLMKNSGGNTKPAKSVGDISHTRSYSLRLMHTISRQNNTTVQVMQSRNELSNSQKEPAAVDGTEDLSPPDTNAEEHPNTQTLANTASQIKMNTSTVLIQQSIMQKNLENQASSATSTQSKTNKKVPRKKSSSNKIVERAKALGLTFERTNIKNGRKGSGNRRQKMKPIVVNPASVAVANGDALLTINGSGSNIAAPPSRLTTELELTNSLQKRTDMDTFEKQLKARVAKFDHSSSFWVEL